MGSSTSSPVAVTGESPTPDWWRMIVHTPGVCGGRARIDGTRIKVKHVYRWVEEEGMTPAQVVEQYPHLTRAQVYAALAYYWSHPDEIEDEDRLVADLKAKAGPSSSEGFPDRRVAVVTFIRRSPSGSG
ncbi:MAG: DUF433 domain-containing protein [Zavarzinella sp.]|nr:DUF433 domain-containing protein [Zavarzinella sp.]